MIILMSATRDECRGLLNQLLAQQLLQTVSYYPSSIFSNRETDNVGFPNHDSSNLFERSTAEQDLESRSIVNTHIMFSYYPFVKLCAMSKIAPHDVNFLEAQGCFRLPTRPILDEFVQEYFLHVHPILPIINEKTFWKMYDDHDSNQFGLRPISLLVFHAMLFAASSVSLPF
jgi:hypothetical protein